MGIGDVLLGFETEIKIDGVVLGDKWAAVVLNGNFPFLAQDAELLAPVKSQFGKT